MHNKTAEFRFYEELNDFLPADQRKVAFSYVFSGTPSVKDAIEAIGVPHTDVDLVVVNERSVGFDYHLQNEDRVAVYPTFESVDISPITKLKAGPLRDTRFVIDTHLGGLARRLRMLGFDTVYERHYLDVNIVAVSVAENRIILTRDRGILKNKAVTHGYWLRCVETDDQVREVLDRFDLHGQMTPFARCLECNGLIARVDKNQVADQLPPRTAEVFEDFYKCESCGKVYWKGSHYDRMKTIIDTLEIDEGDG